MKYAIAALPGVSPASETIRSLWSPIVSCTTAVIKLVSLSNGYSASELGSPANLRHANYRVGLVYSLLSPTIPTEISIPRWVKVGDIASCTRVGIGPGFGYNYNYSQGIIL